MEPVTHLLTGAVLARTGFNRKAAYATLAMTLAAEAPDLDVLWGMRGPVAGFEHHRGITHTLVGLPVEAAVVVGVVWAVHRIRIGLRARARDPAVERSSSADGDETLVRPLTYAPVRWGLLYGFSLVALVSHLLLDWTNNYGIRPLFPFNPRWYAGSFVFIVEPVMLVLLIGALVAPALFGLIAGEVGARRSPFRGRGWAVAALAGIVCLWGLRYVEHDAAVRLATNGGYGVGGEQVPEVLRVTANPSPLNPFVWHTVAELPAFYQFARVDTLRGVVETDPNADLLFKPAATEATLAAKRSWLGRVYLDWSSWPVVTEVGPAAVPSATARGGEAVDSAAPTATEVTFRDLRFTYDVPGRDWRTNPPLGGDVFVDLTRPEPGRIASMVLGGSVQR